MQIIKATFDLPEFLSTHQKSAYSTDSFLRYRQFSFLKTRVATPIFDHAHPNILQTACNCSESASHAKNQAFSSFCSRDIVNLKMLQADWLRAFLPISQEPDFSQVWDLCKNTTNNTNFLYRPNSEKIKD